MRRFKRMIFTLVLGATSYTASAQQLDYKILSNDPGLDSKLSINTDLFQMDMMTGSLESWSFNYGVWGHYEVVPNKIGTQFLFRKSMLALGKLSAQGMPGNTELELGGYYTLRTSSPTNRTKVTLNAEYSGRTYSTNYKGESVSSYTVTETFVHIPSLKKKYLQARAGLYHKSRGTAIRYLGEDYFYTEDEEFMRYASSGIYIGINGRTLTSIFIDTEQYGVQFNSIGRDIYFDVLVLPNRSFRDLEGNDITDEVRDFSMKGPLGFRVGYKLFQTDKKTETGKTFGLCANAEFGARPYDGFFFSAGLGITLVK